jgi:hypothetical protein
LLACLRFSWQKANISHATSRVRGARWSQAGATIFSREKIERFV